MEFFDLTVLGNSLKAWLIAAAAFVVTLTGLWLVKKVVVSRLGRLAARTGTTIDDAAVDLIGLTKAWLLLAVAVYAGSIFLALPERAAALIGSVAAIALIAQSGLWVSAIVAEALERSRKRQLETAPANVTTLNAIGFISKMAVWVVVLLLALDNLGIDVTALVAGLGVGGVAVALAVQNILGDLFASLSIVFDKPFAVGDFLIIDEHMGSVEHVGLKTTRIRSLSGEQLIFSNSDLLRSRIRNFGRMYQRRVVFKIGVTYQTPRDQIVKIPLMLREAVEAHDQARFDRAHFKEYGDFSLNFETVYYVGVPDYNVYMDIQQAINLFIHERFERDGIEFAYPTQTLLVQSQAAA